MHVIACVLIHTLMHVHVGGYGAMRLCASNLCVVHICALLAFESCMCNDVYSCATCFVEMQ